MKKMNVVRILSMFTLTLVAGCDTGSESNDSAVEDVSGDVGSAREKRQQVVASMEQENVEREGARYGSCENVCGFAPPDKSCWCDDSCSSLGDCCRDYERECKDSDENEKPDSDSDSDKYFEITGYSLSGDCGQSNTTTIVTHSKPGGFTDYFQATLDDFQVSLENGVQHSDCRIRLNLKWTPGKRLRLDGFQIDGYAELFSRELRQVSMRSRFGFSGSSARTKSINFKRDFEGEYNGNWGGYQLGVYSSCSGHGDLVIDMSADLRGNRDSSSVLTLDQVSGLIDFAGYGAPKCY